MERCENIGSSWREREGHNRVGTRVVDALHPEAETTIRARKDGEGRAASLASVLFTAHARTDAGLLDGGDEGGGDSGGGEGLHWQHSVSCVTPNA